MEASEQATAIPGATADGASQATLLQAALDSMLDPYVVLEAVRSGTGEIVDFRYVVANQAACEFNGRTHDELVGARLLTLHPAAQTTGLFDGYRTIIETGEPLVLEDWPYPQDLLGGQERRYDVRAVRVGDGVSQTWRDVTERSENAARLQSAMHEFRLLAENAADVVIRTRNGVALWVSPSITEELGWDPADLIGTDLTELVHPDDRHLISKARASLRPGQANSVRYRVRNVAGDWTWMHTRSRLWVSDGGHVDGVVGAMRNVDAEVAAVAALNRSRALYRGVFRAVGEGLMVVTEEGSVVQANPSCTRILGVDAEDLHGCNLSDWPWQVIGVDGSAMSPDDWPFHAAVRTGSPQRGILMGVTHADGSMRWLVVGAEPISSDDGSALVVVSFTDVTDLRHVEARLADEHDRLELVLTSIGLATWVWRVPCDEIEFDEGWAHLTGYSMADVGRLTHEGWRAMVATDDRAGVDAAMAEALDGGAPGYDMVYRVRHRKGHWVWIRERGHVLQRDADGHAIHLMGTQEDVSELQAAHEALRTSEARYRLLAENASSIVSLADADGTLRWISPSVERLLGWQPEELLGKGVWAILHPEDLSAVEAARQRTLTGEDASVELRARTPDNEYRWFTLLLRPTFDERGAIAGRVGGWRDIDAEHRAREELARSRMELQYLASHDPLTGLLNRREFTERADAVLREADGPVGLLYVDLDHFKDVNDTYGHAIGDAVLQATASRIAGCCAHTRAARIGGDEFVVLVVGAADEADLGELAARIEHAASQPVSADGVTVDVTVSVGGALGHPAHDLDVLMAQADSALYESKRNGRARTTMYTAS